MAELLIKACRTGQKGVALALKKNRISTLMNATDKAGPRCFTPVRKRSGMS